MSKDYSEDKLIQASAAELLEKELGWTAVYGDHLLSKLMSGEIEV